MQAEQVVIVSSTFAPENVPLCATLIVNNHRSHQYMHAHTENSHKKCMRLCNFHGLQPTTNQTLTVNVYVSLFLSRGYASSAFVFALNKKRNFSSLFATEHRFSVRLTVTASAQTLQTIK